jgi:carnitine O-acetyltransferase
MSTVRLTDRPLDWKAVAPESPGITFGSQRNLPKLPVPELNETLARLKETLKPIAWSNEEYSSAEKKIDDFALNKGPELQKRLFESSKLTPHWLEQWWDDGAYLGYRDSVIYIPVSNVNSKD